MYPRWTFFDRESVDDLGPVYDGGLDPVFRLDPHEDAGTIKGAWQTIYFRRILFILIILDIQSFFFTTT